MFRIAAKSGLALIEGYKGSASISLSTARTQYREAFEIGELPLTLQSGLEPNSDIKDAPHIYQFARTKEDEVFDLIFGAQGLGHSFVAPPGVAPERVAVLRNAFQAAMQDPELIAEADKLQLDLRRQSGEPVQAFIQRVYAAPKEVADHA